MSFTPSENPITHPTRESYTELRPFRFWCQKVLPLVYDDSLSYYELLCKVVDYLNKTMEDVDHMNTDMDTLYSNFQEFQEGTFRIYNELVTYVNNYFDNLDVQQEINNKLDAMATDGVLTSLIEPLIPDLVASWLRDNITPTTPAIDGSLTVAGAGADSNVTGHRINSLNNLTIDYLESKNQILNVFKANPVDSLYATGIQGTYIHLLSDGDIPIIIPKSTRLLNFTLICNSNSQKEIHLYILKLNSNYTFTVVRKFSNLAIFHKTSFVLELSLTEDAYIAVQQLTDYTIWRNENNSDAQTNMKPYTLGNNVNTSVGDTLSGGYQDIYYNIGANIDIFIGENFANIVGNNSFAYKNINITEEVGYFQNTGFRETLPRYVTIFNIQNSLLSSSVGDTSHPMQVRDINGNIVNDIDIINVDSINNDAWLIVEFDISGKYLRSLTVGDFKTNGISDDCYFICSRIFRNYNSGIMMKPVAIEWLNSSDSNTYHVGTGKDFETFTEMCEALKYDTRNKTVYIDEGTYDIYQEYGGDNYMSNLDPTGLNWRDVSYIVPENTHIIGIGKVVLTWMPSTSAVGSNEKAFLFSPLNVDGSCIIENIEIVCQNCRYAIHDEISGNPSRANITRKYINVVAKKISNAYNTEQVFGCGLAQNGYYQFDNCIFEGYSNWIFTMHDWAQSANDKARVVINNTVIKKVNSSATITGACFGLGNTNTSERDNDVSLNNCWLCGNVLMYAEGDNPSVTVNSYNIKEIGCNTHSVQTQLTNNKMLLQLN